MASLAPFCVAIDFSSAEGEEDFAFQFHFVEGAVFAFAEGFVDIKRPFQVRVNDGNLGDRGASWSEGACVQVEDFGGLGAEFADGFQRGEDSLVGEVGEGDADGAFQPHDPEGCFIKGDLFFVGGVGSVISADAIYGSVGECLSDDVHVRLSA